MEIIEQDNLLEMRQAEKKASREEDLLRLENGVPAEEIQRENSLFSMEEVQKFEIKNLSKVVGR